MNKHILLFFVLSFTVIACTERNSPHPLRLWYEQPASEWMQALPIGNGRLGGMIFGGIEKETISLNEITIWAGQPNQDQEQVCGKERLTQIRQEFFEGRIDKGNTLAGKYLTGNAQSFGTHLPIGDINIDFTYSSSLIKNYKRELDLQNGIIKISYKIDNITYQREYFCSNPDDLFIFKYSADEKNALNFSIHLDMLRDVKISTEENSLSFFGEIQQNGEKAGVTFTGKIAIETKEGYIKTENELLHISQADEVIFYVDIRTDYKQPSYAQICNKTISNAKEKDYTLLKNRHIQDFSNLFNRVELNLGKNNRDNIPTDIRWKQLKEGKESDPFLDVLFFQYGRYLLVSSSRENSPLPANLQGIWNDNLANNMGWNCDYHLDINIQQNYWPANITHLHECNIPLFNYIEDLSIAGEETARKVYGSPGWVAHTVTNVWDYTAPGEGVGWGLFPTASCWIASHLWEHYLYTCDLDFLKQTAYPILKKNALFFLDYMVKHPVNGYLMTGPTTSPENSFLFQGESHSLSMMPTCDKVLITEIYNACIESSLLLEIDEEFRRMLQNALNQFPPFRIGKNGGLQEWFEDYEEAQPNHRHTTHLLAFYPYSQITQEQTPELAQAVRKTIELREAAEGWEDVEWSRANMICTYARLKDVEKAYESIGILQRNFTRENLLTISPEGIAGAPYDIFILDGNTAATAGMAEMLIQNHEGYIEFLPVLPTEWEHGYVKGLCVKNGIVADLTWKKGKIRSAKLKVPQAGPVHIRFPDISSKTKIKIDNDKVNKETQNDLLTIHLKKGGTITIDNN